jgi:hypothetical protein
MEVPVGRALLARGARGRTNVAHVADRAAAKLITRSRCGNMPVTTPTPIG